MQTPLVILKVFRNIFYFFENQFLSTFGKAGRGGKHGCTIVETGDGGSLRLYGNLFFGAT